VRYHDEVWGVPLYDDRALFRLLCLEGFQAGLSWLTILRKEAAFDRAFEGFDPERVAHYEEARLEALMADAGIVRNRAKIEATVGNARAWLTMMENGPAFASFLWDFVGGRPVQNRWTSLAEVPAETPISRAVSKALKQRGYRFVGPTICYAFMQAAGLVNDHVVDCFRHGEVAALAQGSAGASAGDTSAASTRPRTELPR
jgi:DNA-3-methyladenine glycosylase I